jgi:hypothetical protein
MKRPEPFRFDPRRVAAELDALNELLGDPTKELSERDDVLPFFKQHKHAAALLGGFHAPTIFPDVLSSELEIFGDWACDLVVGDKVQGHFCFVEFENATPDSVFRRGKKGVPDWSARLEHGLSQINDWFYHLSNNAHTPQFRSFFTSDLADYTGVLVIGRDAFLTDDMMHRLRWRARNTLVAGKRVTVITFDELFEALKRRSKVYLELLTPTPTPSEETPE